MAETSPAASSYPPSLSTSAYVIPPRQNSYSSNSDSDDVDSLPSEPATLSDLETLSSNDEDDDYSDAEAEWRESIQQLELLLTMVLVPFVGKYFGRKCAYWGWTKYMEWKYPVEVVVTNKGAFKGAGAVGALASL